MAGNEKAQTTLIGSIVDLPNAEHDCHCLSLLARLNQLDSHSTEQRCCARRVPARRRWAGRLT